MKRLVSLSFVASALAVGGCNSSTDGADPGPVTQEEAEALEDAASMLDEQRMDQDGPASDPAPSESPDGEPE